MKNVANDSLIVNGDFRDGCLVNQRGQTEYTAAGYTVDMWNMGIDIGTVTVEDDGIVLTAGSSGLTLRQYQEAALLAELEGETLTWSAMYTILAKTTTPGGIGTAVTGAYARRCTFSGDVGVKNVSSGSAVVPTGVKSASWLYIPAGWKIKIHALKLELGDTQTLAHQDSDGNLVLNKVQNYADTLAKCQRYCWVTELPTQFSGMLAAGLIANAETTSRALVQPPVPMRAKPTATIIGSLHALDIVGNKYYPITALVVLANNLDYLRLQVNLSEYPTANAEMLWIQNRTASPAKIIFSAEL